MNKNLNEYIKVTLVDGSTVEGNAESIAKLFLYAYEEGEEAAEGGAVVEEFKEGDLVELLDNSRFNIIEEGEKAVIVEISEGHSGGYDFLVRSERYGEECFSRPSDLIKVCGVEVVREGDIVEMLDGSQFNDVKKGEKATVLSTDEEFEDGFTIQIRGKTGNKMCYTRLRDVRKVHETGERGGEVLEKGKIVRLKADGEAGSVKEGEIAVVLVVSEYHKREFGYDLYVIGYSGSSDFAKSTEVEVVGDKYFNEDQTRFISKGTKVRLKVDSEFSDFKAGEVVQVDGIMDYEYNEYNVQVSNGEGLICFTRLEDVSVVAHE